MKKVLKLGPALALMVLAVVLSACGESDLGTATTDDEDFTVSLRVEDRFLHVGDQVPLRLDLRRTDGSNLDQGLVGPIVITTTVHGSTDLNRVELQIDDQVTDRFVQLVVFSASRPGVAEVRAAFRDAEARIELVVSALETAGTR
jgi:hypothetical protein